MGAACRSSEGAQRDSRRWKGHVSNLTGKQPSYYSQLSGACLDTLHWTGFKFLEP